MDYTVHVILQARILEYVAIPFFRGSSQPRHQTQVSHIAGQFFTSWATREAWMFVYLPTEVHLGYFQFLAVISKVSLNIHIQVLMWSG